jgi:hypothetical protein
MKSASILILFAGLAQAHIGSPDVFLEGSAGPYPLYVTIRPPTVIPGVAEIEIRCSSPAIRELRVTPTPLTGNGAQFAPTPDQLQRSKDDPQFFTGTLWMMAPGSWQVRVQADGDHGSGQLAVPVPAIATRTKPMQVALGAFLLVMTLVLAVGLVSIVGAGSRDGQLDPGVTPDRRRKLRARILMGATAVLVVLILWGGDHWWTAEATGYAENLYKPIAMTASVESGDRLVLNLKDPTWALPRQADDFLPDHGHLMHLYVIREPGVDRVWHLHPELTSTGDIAPVSSRRYGEAKIRMAASSAVFTQNLPPMPAGRYQLYGDVVHASGFPETLVATLTLPNDIAGTPLAGDDAGGVPGSSPDGAHILWDRDASPIKAGRADAFKFRLVAKDGKPVTDTELYMGMLGHAAFVKNDGTVFAHVHPSGSVPMAALQLANPSEADGHSMMNMKMPGLPPEVVFPYGFPTPGDYRVIVQMKHAGIVETGVFDAQVQ